MAKCCSLNHLRRIEEGQCRFNIDVKKRPMEGQTNHSLRNRRQLNLRCRGIESVSESEAAGRRTTRNRHVQKLIVPVLYEAEEYVTLAICKETGNELQ